MFVQYVRIDERSNNDIFILTLFYMHANYTCFKMANDRSPSEEYF